MEKRWASSAIVAIGSTSNSCALARSVFNFPRTLYGLKSAIQRSWGLDHGLRFCLILNNRLKQSLACFEEAGPRIRPVVFAGAP